MYQFIDLYLEASRLLGNGVNSSRITARSRKLIALVLLVPNISLGSTLKTSMTQILIQICRHCLLVLSLEPWLQTESSTKSIIPPPINKSEQQLPRKTRCLLAQLRTNKCPFLLHYLNHINPIEHPSPLCPACKLTNHDTQPTVQLPNQHHKSNQPHVSGSLVKLGQGGGAAGQVATCSVSPQVMMGRSALTECTGQTPPPPLVLSIRRSNRLSNFYCACLLLLHQLKEYIFAEWSSDEATQSQND
jgi:hypothetical protein